MLYVNTYMCTYVNLHIYIHINIYTYRHIYIYICLCYIFGNESKLRAGLPAPTILCDRGVKRGAYYIPFVAACRAA